MGWHTLKTPIPLADMRDNTTRMISSEWFVCFLDLVDKDGTPLGRPGIQVEFDDNTHLLIGNALSDGDEPVAADDTGLWMEWSNVGYKKVVRWRDLLAEPAK